MATYTAVAISDETIRARYLFTTKNSQYRRTLKFEYKAASATSYTLGHTFTLYANQTYNDYFQWDFHNLLPNRNYNVRITIRNVTLGQEVWSTVVSVKTRAASGDFSLEATPKKITATVTGLESTKDYGRNLRFYLDRGYGLEYWGEKYISANATAGTPTFTFTTGIYMGKTHKVKAELWKGTKESPVTLLKTLGTKSVSVPWDGISVAKVNSISHTPPAPTFTVNWGLSLNDTSTSATTVFTFKMRRASGTVVTLGTQTGISSYSKTFNLPSTLVDDETVQVWIEAKAPNSTATSKSPEFSVTLSRLFHWDNEKIAGEDFNITAVEWNRMVNYTNAAAAIYPEYFTAIEDGLVSSGAELTAELANKALGGFYTLSHGQVTGEVTIALPAVPDLNTGIHLEFTFLDSSPHVVNWYEIDIVNPDTGYSVPIYPAQGVGADVRYVSSSNSIRVRVYPGMAPGTPGIATIEGSFVGATDIAQHGTVSADQIVQIEQKLISAMHEATGL